jgi:hypothetical protein
VAEQGFQIQIMSSSMSAGEWKRAMTAPDSELKTVLPLSEEQKEEAKKFDLSEEEYARAELARIYGQRGLREKAQRMGAIVAKMLAEISPQSRLMTIRYEGTGFRWVLGIETPQGPRNLSVSRDLADDVLDSQLFEEMQRLKEHLRSNLTVAAVGGE